MCQTEWDIYQYHLDHPNGDPQDCIYDSGGKKQYVHHHSHGKLVIDPLLADESKGNSDKTFPEGEHDHENETDPKMQENYQAEENNPSMGENEEGHKHENPMTAIIQRETMGMKLILKFTE